MELSTLLPAALAAALALGPELATNGRVRAYLVNDNNQRVTQVVRAICRMRR
ncbi:MAG TPA: hypothetical protein VNS57_07975 [Steroidobacteraceae bacterium]|nr:hypothetical protein [Steroidobacteraceae bacterium]